jgi:hypothetical protein
MDRIDREIDELLASPHDATESDRPLQTSGREYPTGLTAFVESFPLAQRGDVDAAYHLWVEHGFADSPLAAGLLFDQVQTRIGDYCEWQQRVGAMTPVAYLRDLRWRWA